LKKGDIVQTEFMTNFKYDQGEAGCSIHNSDVCNDAIIYSTMSSWVGVGQESKAMIKLTPVKGKIDSIVDEIKTTKDTVTPEVE